MGRLHQEPPPASRLYQKRRIGEACKRIASAE
jgi:hypothetical protein